MKQFTYKMDIEILIGFKRKDFVAWFKRKNEFGTAKTIKKRYEFLTANRKQIVDDDSYGLYP
jgi:hypothetical protein